MQPAARSPQKNLLPGDNLPTHSNCLFPRVPKDAWNVETRGSLQLVCKPGIISQRRRRSRVIELACLRIRLARVHHLQRDNILGMLVVEVGQLMQKRASRWGRHVLPFVGFVTGAGSGHGDVDIFFETLLDRNDCGAGGGVLGGECATRFGVREVAVDEEASGKGDGAVARFDLLNGWAGMGRLVGMLGRW